MSIDIANIVTKKEKVRESKHIDGSFSLEIIIGDSELGSMLELTLTIK